MSKSECWDSFESALAMFEPTFTITREQQGTQESREPLEAFVELYASFTTDESINAATDVKKPLCFVTRGA